MASSRFLQEGSATEILLDFLRNTGMGKVWAEMKPTKELR
jgi:hypothetical protein